MNQPELDVEGIISTFFFVKLFMVVNRRIFATDCDPFRKAQQRRHAGDAGHLAVRVHLKLEVISCPTQNSFAS